MAELLLELFSEEIPARMQKRAAEDLQRLVSDGLGKAGLAYSTAEAHATPRRLVLVVDGLPGKSDDISEERKGPRVGAPDKAIEGFLRAAGLAAIGDAEVVTDEKKGDYYVARINRPGRATAEIVSEIVPDVVRGFPWPKSMRWGTGSLRWVRPLQSILCLFDGKVVPFDIDGVASGSTTHGHRFMGTDDISVDGFADYAKKLKSKKVLLETEARAKLIGREAARLASEAGLELVPDEALTYENAGLTEWPTVLMGTFDEDFLAVPPEVLITTMKAHQKCFSLWDRATGKLANKFLLVTNLKARDGGAAIIDGNERVIRARLSDAKFFWEQDLRKQLEPMRQELGAITFHERLGSQADRVERITELARQIAGAVDAEPELAGRAAQLCKADLVSGMVGEFPELQGLMGRYYAEAEHMDGKIAAALEEHYMPRGANDEVPQEPVSVAVALADKLDTLVGFWAINEKPTGSGDPYQLRRAALGVIRICLENDLRLQIAEYSTRALRQVRVRATSDTKGKSTLDVEAAPVMLRVSRNFGSSGRHVDELALDLLSFFADRLKVYLRDRGERHDLIDAVFALGGQDDLALIVRRVEALSAFLETDDGANLLAGVKRAANILRIEEKKDKTAYDEPVNAALLQDAEEKGLHEAIAKVLEDTEKAIGVENFTGAMRALAELRAPVDAFFEKVTVNADDPAVRANRLRLLSQIRVATRNVADFSKIGGSA